MYKDQMFNMMLASAIFSTVIMLGVILAFKERPGAAVFKSRSGSEDLIVSESSAKQDLSLMVQMKLCMTNKAFVLVGLGNCGVIMHMYVFTTLIG